jgi:hypothetical protein
MPSWVGSNGFRVAAYAVAAAAALAAAWRERRRRRDHPDLWPTFWFMTAAVLLAMAVARVIDLGSLASELGRSEARSQGWYDRRREIQAIVVGSLGGVWFVVEAVALWRVPARRRRYLPEAIVVFTLICFAGVRIVSLHQIDAVLYRREFAGVQRGAVLELTGIVLAIALTFWQPPPRQPASVASTVRSETDRVRLSN